MVCFNSKWAKNDSEAQKLAKNDQISVTLQKKAKLNGPKRVEFLFIQKSLYSQFKLEIKIDSKLFTESKNIDPIPFYGANCKAVRLSCLFCKSKFGLLADFDHLFHQ